MREHAKYFDKEGNKKGNSYRRSCYRIGTRCYFDGEQVQKKEAKLDWNRWLYIYMYMCVIYIYTVRKS